MMGRTLGRCRIERKLATGGFANVYFAITEPGHREVAVKVLLPGLINDAVTVERFHLEAEAAAKIHHPNVVRVLESGQEGENYFIVMEFVRGEPLEIEMRRISKMPFDRATRICRDLAKALEAAHAAGVVHRDVKPGNVVIDGDGIVKLTDFGIARDLVKPRGLTAPDVMIGTPEFMSPEQVDGGTIDARSDVYSLGIMYYYLLTGIFPFYGDTDVSMAMARLKQKPVPVTEADPEVDPRCVPILDKMLQKDPKHRIQSAREAADAFGGAIYGMSETKARVQSSATVAAPRRTKESTRRTVQQSKAQSKRPPTGRKTVEDDQPAPRVSMAMVALSGVLVLAAATLMTRGGRSGLALALGAGSLLAAIIGIAFARERVRTVAGWFAVGLTFVGLATVLIGALAASPQAGVWTMISSRAGLATLGAALLAVVTVASIGRQPRGAHVTMRRMTVFAGLAMIYMGVAGFDALHGPLALFKASIDTAIPLTTLSFFAAFFGGYLLTGYEMSKASRAFGGAFLGIAAFGTALIAAAGRGGGALGWADIGSQMGRLLSDLASRALADGATVSVGVGLVGAALALLAKPLPKGTARA